MGYDYTGGTPAPVVNGFDGLVPVNVESAGLTATPSTTGLFYANLDDSAAVVAAANLPSANAATAEYSHKSSLVVYDTVGKEVLLDFYYTKTANDTWEVAVFDRSTATPTTGFPYGAGPLATQTLTFDPALNGALAAASATDITLPFPAVRR
jgi:flagellar hook protein FlgE